MSWPPLPVMPPEVLAGIEGNDPPPQRERSVSGRYWRCGGDDVGWRFDAPGVVCVDYWEPLDARVVGMLDLIDSSPAPPDGLPLYQVQS